MTYRQHTYFSSITFPTAFEGTQPSCCSSQTVSGEKDPNVDNTSSGMYVKVFNNVVCNRNQKAGVQADKW